MRLGIIWAIFRKEITEALRDWLTLLVLIGLPVLGYPLMIILASEVESRQAIVEDRHVSTVALWGGGAAPLIDWLGATNNHLKLEPWQGMPAFLRGELEAGRLRPPRYYVSPRAKPEKPLGLGQIPSAPDIKTDKTNVLFAAGGVVTSRQADAVLIVWPGFDDALERHALSRVSVYYDSVIPNSALAWSRLSSELGNLRNHLVKDRQHALGLPEGFVTALEVHEDNIAPIQRQVVNIFANFMPLLFVMLSVIGSMMAAVDMTAGEKDRSTMQTLLCAPVRSLEIVTGKFFAVWAVGLTSALINVACCSFLLWRAASLVHMRLIPFGTLSLVTVLLVPATWTIAALFVAVAALARDSKDAGNFLGPLLFVLVSPLAATLLPGVELNSWTCFAPLANLSLLIRGLLLGHVAGRLVFLTLLSSLAYAGLALALAARVFGREQILLGGPFTWRSLLRGTTESRAPTPGFVLTMFGLVLVGFFYGGLILISHGLLATLLITQFGVLLLPSIGLSVARKFPLAETFSLRRPHWRNVVGSALIGLTAGLAVSGLVSRVISTPEEWTREFLKLLQLGDKSAPLWKLWLVLALTPALCEETFFRGLLLSGLRRWGPGAAIGISALLFGLLHGSIYQLLPTFILGLLLGYAVWRSGSLYCSILIHILNNGLVATLVWNEHGGASAAEPASWRLTLAALGVMLGGLALLRGPKSSHSK